jgi:hypothetical protein
VNSRVVVPLSPADLQRERPNLERGSVAAEGVTGLALGACCEVELVFPSGEKLTVPARAVFATGTGTVFAFDGVDRAALTRHLAAPPAEPAQGALAGAAINPGTEPGPEVEAEPGTALADDDAEATDAHAASVHERLRGLPIVEQLRVARDGSITERVALERLYGKVVWEALLRNNRITVPEIIRLAKMGTMPRPLLELIVSNHAWLQVPQIRRALLGNPRLSHEMVSKVLQLLPRDELKVVPQTTAYPASVRMAAKAMLGR